ncbi:hypothetical protein [Halomonas colorata]|uniref:hypothetical protein n=1 Tax=Halomonas colorata TaxID=2742615 RepID=UPI001867F6CF|nr:hypothetical protein [Halomonas colorata]
MIRKITGSLAVVILIAGCSTPQKAAVNEAAKPSRPELVRVEIDPERIQEAQEAVRGILKDPESTMFRNVYGASTTGPGAIETVCGEFNSKNSYSGYVGFAPFAYSQGKPYIWRDTKSFNAENAMIELSCDR